MDKPRYSALPAMSSKVPATNVIRSASPELASRSHRPADVSTETATARRSMRMTPSTTPPALVVARTTAPTRIGSRSSRSAILALSDPHVARAARDADADAETARTRSEAMKSASGRDATAQRQPNTPSATSTIVMPASTLAAAARRCSSGRWNSTSRPTNAPSVASPSATTGSRCATTPADRTPAPDGPSTKPSETNTTAGVAAGASPSAGRLRHSTSNRDGRGARVRTTSASRASRPPISGG